MSLSLSRALAKTMLDSMPFNAAMADCLLKVYSGTVPANVDPLLPASEAALGDATLLCTYSDNGEGGGLDWDAAAILNVLSKDSTQVWKGTPVANGTASFFRIVLSSDDGTASASALRVQGTVGTVTGELLVSNLTYATTVDRTITSFLVALIAG